MHRIRPALHRPLLPLIALLAARAALAQDSGLGTDLQFGNDLDPDNILGIGCDPKGATWLGGERKRTPSGFLYDCVPERAEPAPAGDWLFGGTLELGHLSIKGDGKALIWSRYNDFDDGLIASLDLNLLRPADGRYAELRAAYVDDDSQYYRLLVGRAGQYRLQAFARSQVNVTSSNAESLWANLGAQQLVLQPELTPGATTQAQVDAFMAVNPEARLKVTRDKQGVGINYLFDRHWSGFLNASSEQRKGSRPFGGPFSFGRLVETLRPIDDSTHNFNGGLRFAGSLWRLELAYTGSFFRNGMDHFTYEMPYPTTNNNPVGLFSYEPENDYHRLGFTLTRKLHTAWNGEFSLGAAATRLRQDEALVPGLAGCSGMLNATISCDNWNAPASLSRGSAGLGIDNTRFTGKLVLQPSNTLTWRTTASYLDEDYKGEYLAYNPLTGQYGYIGENGAFPNTTWLPGASNLVHVRNLPLDKRTVEAGTGLDWRLDARNTLGANYGYTHIERSNREFKTTTDRGVKLNWVNRSSDSLTLRFNYGFLDRSGGEYNPDPYQFMYTEELPGFVVPATGLAPHTVDEMRKYDVGERRQHKFDVMGTLALPRDMTLYASLRAERNRYDGEIGRRGYGTLAASLQWEWQPGEKTTLSAWYGYDRSKLGISNTNDVPAGRDGALGGVAPADGGTSAYPAGYRWWMDDTQRNHNGGFALRHRLGRATLDLDWNYLDARGITAWDAESANASPTATAAGLTGVFPDMLHRVNTLTASLKVPFGRRLSLRWFGTWEHGKVFDWHYTGFDADRTTGNMIYTDGGPRSYEAGLIGATLELRL